MAELPTAVDIARRVADALANAGMRYAIGGALALAYYAPPRATVDVDINVFVSPGDGLTQLLSVLAVAGYAADSPESIRDRLVAMVGEDDERVTEWDSIIRDVREAK